jgi:hypothetical protein
MLGYASLTQATLKEELFKIKVLREPLVHFMFIDPLI